MAQITMPDREKKDPLDKITKLASIGASLANMGSRAGGNTNKAKPTVGAASESSSSGDMSGAMSRKLSRYNLGGNFKY